MRVADRQFVRQIIACAILVAAFAFLVTMLPIAPVATRTGQVQEGNALGYSAKVISVSDGDSITVRTDQQTIKIRLAQIDAPELSQPWGQKSKQQLASLVANKAVKVIPHGHDRYGRTIGDIEVDGRSVNRDMVARGAAWAYPDYVRDKSMIDSEEQARASRLGLWAMPNDHRMPPWDYRAQQRDTAAVGR
jgi:endonuclease YncB( thermonuclease family)